MWRYSELRRPNVSRWRTSFNNSNSMTPIASSRAGVEGCPQFRPYLPSSPTTLGCDTCMIHVSWTKAEPDGLYPGAWRVVVQRADQRVPTHGGRERACPDDAEAQPDDLRHPAGDLAPRLRPHDRLLRAAGHRPPLRTPLTGTAHSHPRVGVPRDRALGLVRVLGRSTRVARLPWPRSADSPASCTAPIPRTATCRRPFGVG